MKHLYKYILGTVLSLCPLFSGKAQMVTDANKSTGIDTTEVTVTDKSQTSDRNVMLNAANNTGPRDVNIGLPASVGGTTILENGLPVVYFFWPEMPTKAWRQDAVINRVSLYDLGQTAIRIGDVGFSVDTYDNLGTPEFMGRGTLQSNNYGLLRGDINLSGPISRNGWKYTVGAYASFDPGTFKPADITRYFADRAQVYKAGITKDYKYMGSSGSVSLLYKYVKVQGITSLYAPFIYKKDGKVGEIPGFKMGRDSYMERSGKLILQDAFTGQYVERDIIKDYGAASQAVDLIGDNTFYNGLKLNYVVRFRHSKVGHYLPIMTGVSPAGDNYTYTDGTPYTGENVQNVMVIASRRTPITSVMGTFELGKRSGRHDWLVGLNQWYYDIDKFVSETVSYAQEVKPNPRRLIDINNPNINQYGYVPGGFEYHNGWENKTALYFQDRWNISRMFDINYGMRLEYQAIRGDFQDRNLNLDNLNGPKTDIKKDWLNKSAMVSGVWKATGRFGLLGDATYNEQAGHLENYSVGEDPHIKKSQVIGGGFGLFYNHPWFSLVSKATIIQRDEYRTTVNFSNPANPAEVQRVITSYDIQTIGWTTDIMASLFKNFDLHFLVTWQAPKYKNYKGTVNFGDGVTSDYNFSDKIVTGVPKFLMEIDPSYTWKDLRVWASARYFSKQYFNKPNTLYMAGRWETFAGLSYRINKYLNANVTFVNLLNQTGANGSLPDADLIMTDEAANQKIGQIMSGTYIRPFTVEFSLNYNF